MPGTIASSPLARVPEFLRVGDDLGTQAARVEQSPGRYPACVATKAGCAVETSRYRSGRRCISPLNWCADRGISSNSSSSKPNSSAPNTNRLPPRIGTSCAPPAGRSGDLPDKLTVPRPETVSVPAPAGKAYPERAPTMSQKRVRDLRSMELFPCDVGGFRAVKTRTRW
jgi:hypothetical protein